MPIGQGNFLFSRCYISDVGVAARMALEKAPAGEVYDVSESQTWTMRGGALLKLVLTIQCDAGPSGASD
jgi:hypothetical protein